MVGGVESVVGGVRCVMEVSVGEVEVYGKE